jgi:hypothetical protein
MPRNSTTQKKNSSLNISANEEALNTFIAKKQAEDMEEDLRNLIIGSRGISAWHELVKLRVDIRKQRIEEEKEIERARKEKAEIIFVGTLSLFLLGGIIGLVVFLIVQYSR